MHGNFNSQFDVGRVLDQPTLHKYFFWYSVFAVSSMPYVVAARWVSDRRTCIGYWVAVIAMVILALCLLMFLVIPSYMLFQYIDAMGITVMRVVGVVYAICSFMALIGIVVWVAWIPSNGKRTL